MRVTVPIPIVAAALLSACGSFPEYSGMAPMRTPASFDAPSGGPRPPLSVREDLLAAFDDAELKRLVAKAGANNPDLLRSRARLAEQGFNLKQSQGALLPAIDGGLSGSRQEGPLQPSSRQYDLGLDASWEIDVWGKLGSEVKAAQADLAAAAADTEAVRQSLAAQTMQAYFGVIAASRQEALDRRRVESFRSTVELVARRFELGAATLAETSLAQSDLDNARADLESSTQTRNRAARQLKTLVAEYPDDDLHATRWPRLPRSIPSGVPSEVLLARPDLIAAYQAVVAADDRVKVAHRDLFPSFLLTAEGGTRSTVLSQLAESNFGYWGVLGSISAPLFDAGQRQNEHRAAEKRAEQAYRSWQSTVLSAFEEVENALGAEHYLAREETARLAALKAGETALTRTRRDFEAGTTDLLNLLETQRRLFQTERETIVIRQARLDNRVALALALGKGV